MNDDDGCFEILGTLMIFALIIALIAIVYILLNNAITATNAADDLALIDAYAAAEGDRLEFIRLCVENVQRSIDSCSSAFEQLSKIGG
jgi:hypothetical protein